MEEQEMDMELASERVPVPQIQKIAEEAHVETTNKVTSSSRVKPRLRKKALHAAILKQMEFYFSDANLCKDRFLKNLIKENPYIDLNIFTKFNRIRDLTVDTSRIAKALHGSTFLELSDDGTKVKRVSAVTEKENIDECTIYVQNLPPDADHEMLSTIFSLYGKVVYVSVPRYKSNKKIKGFAFVEFETPENAQKCFKAFKKKGCVLPSNTSPNDLLSIITFDNSEKDVTQCTKMLGIESDEQANLTNCINNPDYEEQKADVESNEIHTDGNGKSEEEQKDCKKTRKRKQSLSPTYETNNLQCDDTGIENETSELESQRLSHKKLKSEIQNDGQNKTLLNNEVQTEAIDDLQNNSSTKKVELDGEDIATNEATINVEVEDVNMIDVNDEDTKNQDKKKKRKRKRRSRTEEDTYAAGFQIMTKRDWKVLRNKYLTLQRTKMKQLKQHLRKTRWNQWSNYEKNKPEKEDCDETEKLPKQENATTARYTFTPGVIVKIDMDKPCTDTKSFKVELRGTNGVKYIDIDEGSYQAYVRCDTAETAHALAQKTTQEKQMTILNDEEERMYWNKIEQDREEKLNKKVRVKQRGRDKLLKKAEKELGKHIKFDEV